MKPLLRKPDETGLYYQDEGLLLMAAGRLDEAAAALGKAISAFGTGEYGSKIQHCYGILQRIYAMKGEYRNAYQALIQYYEADIANRPDEIFLDFYKVQKELEMSREQLIARMLCSEARVDMQAMRVGDLSGDDWSSLADAMTALTPTQFYIDDTAGITVAEMRTKLRRLKLETGKLDMVVIDYLQLMNYTGRAENRTQIVAEITRALKMLARELAVPIVLLSQLSRAPEQRPISERRPRMSDLRESGAIEQDADVIIMLYRPAVYDPEAGNEAYAIIAKHRNGPTGDIQLVWDGAHASFMSVAYREE